MYPWRGFQVGDKVTVRRRLSQDDFLAFARLSGDENPIHTDALFSARTRFGRPVAHGMFLYGAHPPQSWAHTCPARGQRCWNRN